MTYNSVVDFIRRRARRPYIKPCGEDQIQNMLRTDLFKKRCLYRAAVGRVLYNSSVINASKNCRDLNWYPFFSSYSPLIAPVPSIRRDSWSAAFSVMPGASSSLSVIHQIPLGPDCIQRTHNIDRFLDRHDRAPGFPRAQTLHRFKRLEILARECPIVLEGFRLLIVRNERGRLRLQKLGNVDFALRTVQPGVVVHPQPDGAVQGGHI
jgi:hypothetical protein